MTMSQRALPPRAWVLLKSDKRLDLLHPHLMAWDDDDLATGLARTYRWSGHSQLDLPLSVAQHWMTVLALRVAQTPRPLTAGERLRELLHDTEEALIGSFDPISPLKPHLSDGYRLLTARLTQAVAHRYRLPNGTAESHAAHKHADRLAAASEAAHVVGRSRSDIRYSLRIGAEPLEIDPVATPPGMRPWEPWPPKLAARLFLDTLRDLRDGAADEPPPCRVSVAPYSQPTTTRAAFVSVEIGDRMGHLEGEIAVGVREEDGSGDLDGVFTLRTEGGDLANINGWCCVTEVL